MTKLVPCPFCGGEANARAIWGEWRKPKGYMAGCPVCKVEVTAKTKREAIAKWNTRAYAEPLRELVEDIIENIDTTGGYSFRIEDPCQICKYLNTPDCNDAGDTCIEGIRKYFEEKVK